MINRMAYCLHYPTGAHAAYTKLPNHKNSAAATLHFRLFIHSSINAIHTIISRTIDFSLHHLCLNRQFSGGVDKREIPGSSRFEVGRVQGQRADWLERLRRRGGDGAYSYGVKSQSAYSEHVIFCYSFLTSSFSHALVCPAAGVVAWPISDVHTVRSTIARHGFGVGVEKWWLM